jgi:hypothetical protein
MTARLAPGATHTASDGDRPPAAEVPADLPLASLDAVGAHLDGGGSVDVGQSLGGGMDGVDLRSIAGDSSGAREAAASAAHSSSDVAKGPADFAGARVGASYALVLDWAQPDS